MNVGERIRKIRQEKQMTQKELGEACGIAEPTIRRYELGRLRPKFSTLKKIADGLGVEVVELIDTENPAEKYRFSARDAIEEAGKQAETLNVLNFAFGGYAAPHNTDSNKEAKKLADLIETYSQLSEKGQEKVVEYAEDLSANPKYQKKNDE